MGRLRLLLLFSLLAGGSFAADVGYYGAIKSIMYAQEAGGVPQLWPSNAFGFNAFVVANTNGVLTNATLKLSSSAVVRPLQPETNDMLFRYEQWFNTQAALDAAYPAGSLLKREEYRITAGTVNDIVRTGSVYFWILLSPLSYPATPQLSNLAAGQNIDTTRDFELQWQPLNAGLLPIVQVTIMDGASNLVFASAAPFQPGALGGSSTSVVIPAHSLPPDQIFQGHLSVGNPGNPDTDGIPGATGIAVLGKDTQFNLRTRPAPPPPILTPGVSPAGAFVVEVRGETNRLHRLQTSTSGAIWTDVLATNANAFNYVDPGGTNDAVRLYRAVVGQKP